MKLPVDKYQRPQRHNMSVAYNPANSTVQDAARPRGQAGGATTV